MDSERQADSTTFSQELAALKRRGSTVLVVGQVGDETALRACRRLLGERGPPARRRVIAATDAEAALDRRLPPDHDPARVTVVDSAVRTRSARTAPDRPDHGAVERAILDGVVEQATGDLEPAELRVCLDSLQPLLAADECRARTLLDRIADAVLDHRAIGHVHLPLPYDHRAVSLLATQVDAVIELREGDRPEQRWHLPDGTETDWLPL
ncbi:MAG: hypothetical protein ABEJ23_04750 [Haloarculaceae archaeon]